MMEKTQKFIKKTSSFEIMFSMIDSNESDEKYRAPG